MRADTGQHPVGIPDMGLGAAVATVTFLVLFAGILLANKLTGEKPEGAPSTSKEGRE